jgi:hypothetical protein
METNPQLTRLRQLGNTAIPAVAAEEEYQAFSFGRVGSKSQLTLAIRRVSGTVHGFVYAHLYTVDLEPSLGIILRFTHHRVVLQGRNLDELYRYLRRQMVELIQVVDPLQAETLPEETTVVTSLEVVAIRDDFSGE